MYTCSTTATIDAAAGNDSGSSCSPLSSSSSVSTHHHDAVTHTNAPIIEVNQQQDNDDTSIIINPFSFLYNWQPLKVTTNYHVGYFESTICRVPLHVFVNVLGFMELPEIVNLLLVNRRWSKVLNDDAVWRQLFTFYNQSSQRRNNNTVGSVGPSIFSREARNELPHMIKNWKDLAIARFKYDKIARICGTNLDFSSTVDCYGGTTVSDNNAKTRQISKVCIIGKASCGKSCLVTRLMTGQYQPETIKRTITSNIYSQQVLTTTSIVASTSAFTTTTTRYPLTSTNNNNNNTINNNDNTTDNNNNNNHSLLTMAPPTTTLGLTQASDANDCCFEQVEQSPHEPFVCNMDIIDTAGAERYDRFIPTHLKTANVIVMTFDLSQEDSLNCIVEGGRFYKPVQTELEKNKILSPRVIVVGLKSDLKTDNKLSFKALQFCMRHQFPYYECSSKSEDSVRQVNNILAYFALEKARMQQTEEQAKKK